MQHLQNVARRRNDTGWSGLSRCGSRARLGTRRHNNSPIKPSQGECAAQADTLIAEVVFQHAATVRALAHSIG